MTEAALRAKNALPPEVLEEVRRSVRQILEKAPAYQSATDEQKRELARGMVDLGLVAAGLIDIERKSDERLRKRRKPRALASAQSAGAQLGMEATRAAAGTLTGLRDAIDFPNYVGSLITGVFQAILNSSATQLGSLSDVVESVGVSADDYASSVDDGEVARWLCGKFPRLLRPANGGDGVEAAPGVDLEEHAAQIQQAIGADADVTDSDALLESARRKMAQDKQATLATMIQMGLQRIVVDEGRIHASMDLRVDASSASQEAKAERSDARLTTAASGSFGYGMWSASASLSASIGKVQSDAQQTSEQISARAGLRSSVDLAFRTDQVPLDRVASRSARAHLDNAARGVDVSGASALAPQQNLTAPGLDLPAAATPGVSQAGPSPDPLKKQQEGQPARTGISAPPETPPASGGNTSSKGSTAPAGKEPSPPGGGPAGTTPNPSVVATPPPAGKPSPGK